MSKHGGARPGAGRKSAFEKAQQEKKEVLEGADVKLSINPIKELEKAYKDLKKVHGDDNELNVIKTRVDILNKLLPYVEHKKGVANTDTGKEDKIPTHTTLEVVKGDSEEDKREFINPEDEGDFV